MELRGKGRRESIYENAGEGLGEGFYFKKLNCYQILRLILSFLWLERTDVYGFVV